MNCEHVNAKTIPTPEGPHHAKVVCTDCGKFLGWSAKPENEARNKAERKLIDALNQDSVPLSEWERGFVKSIAQQHPKLSPKQRDRLHELAKKFRL